MAASAPASKEPAVSLNPRDIYAQTTRYFLTPVIPLLDDPTVSEVLINGPKNIYYERAGRLHTYDAKFADENALMAAARNLAEYVNRTLDADHHSMDGRLPDGSRVHVILPPSSRQGVCISIRKFQKSVYNIKTLIERGSLSPAAAEFLQIAVLLHKNMVVAGGTGTGKTSMLNALSTAIPDNERVIVIEDSSELQLHQPHTLYLEAQPARPGGRGAVSIRDLFVDSLRMRPDRILVGEVRRGEALDLIQSMLSGHTGSLTTVHASTPRDAAVRLETLCQMSDVGLPQHVARMQVASAIQVIVQLARFPDGGRRVVRVAEQTGLNAAGEYTLTDLFAFKSEGTGTDGVVRGGLAYTGARPTFASEVTEMGLTSRVSETAAMFLPASDARPVAH